MRPLKIVIPGKFWDSQIYFGRLYLFGVDGSIKTINWNHLINDWAIDENLSLALKCAFSESDFLYGLDQQRITSDPEIKQVVISKFEELSARNLELGRADLDKFLAGDQDSPFPFPHADSFVFNKYFFTASKHGIHQASCTGKTSRPISKLVKKHTDCAALDISLKYNTIAFAAGEEGLFELHYGGSGIRDKASEPRLLTKGNFNSCDWMFWSIYGTSYSGSKLVDFDVSEAYEDLHFTHVDFDDLDENFGVDEKDNFLKRVPTRGGSKKRTLSKVVSDRSIFKATGLSWGSQDKLCLVDGNTLHIVKYNPRAIGRQRLKPLNVVNFYEWKGEIISGAIAHFGTIVECENALVVIPTDGNTVTLPGECVNWRVFPRARNYVNQLHVLYQDRLEIHSFNHDYFVDQSEKQFGIWHHSGQSSSKNRMQR